MLNDTTTAGLLADHWCRNGATPAFRSDLVNFIEFDTSDFRGMNFWISGSFVPLIALAITDIIEFNDAEFDGFLKCFGASWSGKQFKVISTDAKKKIAFML